MVYVFNSSTEEVETRRSEVQGHPQLRGGFETNLGCMRICLRKTKQNKTGSRNGSREYQVILGVREKLYHAGQFRDSHFQLS